MRVVLITNGEMKDLNFYKKLIKKDDFIITVDGGLIYALKMKISPHLAIGDFDSLDNSYLEGLAEKNIQILRFPQEKDFTDTELAIHEALKKNPREIILLGALGSRIDHSFTNIALMAKVAKQGIKCRIINENNDCYFVTDSITFKKVDNRYISIIPVTEELEVKKTEGLYYPLENAVLSFGTSWGISNIAVKDNVSIYFNRGVAMVILASD